MKSDVRSLFQIVFSIVERHPRCRRGICRRYRRCVPPRDPRGALLYRCRFDSAQKWEEREGVARIVLERLMKRVEARYAALGIPVPHASAPAPDHLDLARPLDSAALLGPLWELENSVPRPQSRLQNGIVL